MTVDALFAAEELPAVSAALAPLLQAQLGELASALEPTSSDLAMQVSERQSYLFSSDETESNRPAELLVRRDNPDWCFILNRARYWRDRSQPASGLLLARLQAPAPLRGNDDSLLTTASDYLPASALDRWPQRPSLWLASTTAAAGKYQAFPQQFALFLPEEEGLETTQRTLLLEDFYHQRLLLLTVPALTVYGFDVGSEERELLSFMSQWFRWHDVSHTLHDNSVYRLSGLSGEELHATRELAADLSAIATHPEPKQRRFIPVYVAELLRYAARDDGTRSADALASAVQLGLLATRLNCDDAVELLNNAIREPVRVGELLAELYVTVATAIARADSLRIGRVLSYAADWSRLSSGMATRRLEGHSDLFMDHPTGSARSTRDRQSPSHRFCARAF